MKSVPKLIGRCLRILLFSFVLLVILNLVLFVGVMTKQTNNSHPWATAKEAAEALEISDGSYRLPEEIME